MSPRAGPRPAPSACAYLAESLSVAPGGTRSRRRGLLALWLQLGQRSDRASGRRCSLDDSCTNHRLRFCLRCRGNACTNYRSPGLSSYRVADQFRLGLNPGPPQERLLRARPPAKGVGAIGFPGGCCVGLGQRPSRRSRAMAGPDHRPCPGNCENGRNADEQSETAGLFDAACLGGRAVRPGGGGPGTCPGDREGAQYGLPAERC